MFKKKNIPSNLNWKIEQAGGREEVPGGAVNRCLSKPPELDKWPEDPFKGHAFRLVVCLCFDRCLSGRAVTIS